MKPYPEQEKTFIENMIIGICIKYLLIGTVLQSRIKEEWIVKPSTTVKKHFSN